MGRITIQILTDEEKKTLQIPPRPCGAGPWAVWECEPSSFDWHYDEVEKAYVYEGRVKVRTKDGEVEIKAGDYVTFPKGLACSWTVLERVKKVYKFE